LEKYFLRLNIIGVDTEWQEVTQRQFIEAGRNAGFYGPVGELHTAGFNAGGVIGRIEHSKNKPHWWPKNPYPESVCSMTDERYAEIVPDEALRTSISWFLGHLFWDIASDAIWERMQEAIEDEGWKVP